VLRQRWEAESTMRQAGDHSIRRRVALVVAFLTLCTVGHFVTPHGQRTAHEFLFKATYVPIILAGLWFGVKGGLATSLATSVLYLLHVGAQLGGQLLTTNLGRTLDILLYNGIALVTGTLSQAQLRARWQAESLAEERAGLHAQLEESYQALQQRTEDLIKTEEQLRQASRLATLGELAAGLAHEIRNPLNGLSGAARIVSRPDVSVETRAEFADILQKETRRLNNVVHDFLDLAATRDGEGEETRLEEVVRRVTTLVRTEASQRSVAVEHRMPAQIRIEVASALLEQILLNLVLNAIQAMPNGGTVTVAGTAEADRLLLTVQDTGEGIAPENAERVFTPFFTTKPGGTGLGLVIARRIARGLGGDITVRSVPGEGTEFALSMPLTPPPVPRSDVFSASQESPADEQDNPSG
jgi:signal transduction histidine kinase